AIAFFRAQQPDVVLLDVDMPRINGFTALKSIREISRTVPVIMFGSFAPANEAAVRNAIDAGATDCVSKPTGVGHIDTVMAYLQDTVVSKIMAWGQSLTTQGNTPVRGDTKTSVFLPPQRERGIHSTPSVPIGQSQPTVSGTRKRGGPVHVVAIGSSTGGPNALVDVISQLPKDIGVPILIVQHMPPMFTQLLAERLDRSSPLRAREGFDGAVIQPGEVWIAPGDFHMTVARQGNNVVLKTNQNAPENSCRPAVDVLFRSVADVYGSNTLGVMLTGMGRDGTAGCRALSESGAGILAQDEASSVVWGMPRSVVEAGLADCVLSLKDIAPAITTRIQGSQSSPGRTSQAALSRGQMALPV
ncbi:MAG: chemotaxis-specific protein-glutamate methyltransferase CheB, partial [Planctomycetaceae bacterium]|nr:chemotaxis-specific protein-glutamate methyltransferase CheB [Planctomycetaceae bacterium]